MKRINFNSTATIPGFLLILVSFFSSCDKGFEEMNKNPNAYTEPVLGNRFTSSRCTSGESHLGADAVAVDAQPVGAESASVL